MEVDMTQATCAECGCPVQRGNRGPAPKRCPDCKRQHRRKGQRPVEERRARARAAAQKRWAGHVITSPRNPNPRPVKACERCGVDYRTARCDQRYCSETCRYEAYCEQRGNGWLLTTCEHCAETFPKRQRWHRRYCSDDCQLRAQRRRYRAKLVPIPCDECGKTFMGRRWGKYDRDHQNRYCSDACQREAISWRKRTVLSCPLNWLDCKQCGRRFNSRFNKTSCDDCWTPTPKPLTQAAWIAGYCQECGDPFVQASRHTVRYCSHICKERAKRQDRRVREKDAFVERVFRRKVFERDNYTCQLCGEPTSERWSRDDPLAPTVDHIQPLNKGGEHSYANTQCAHLVCNSRKQDNVDPFVQLRLAA